MTIVDDIVTQSSIGEVVGGVVTIIYPSILVTIYNSLARNGGIAIILEKGATLSSKIGSIQITIINHN